MTIKNGELYANEVRFNLQVEIKGQDYSCSGYWNCLDDEWEITFHQNGCGYDGTMLFGEIGIEYVEDKIREFLTTNISADGIKLNR